MTFFCWFPLLKIRLCKTYFRCTFSGVRGILSYFQRTSKLSKPARNCISHFSTLWEIRKVFSSYLRWKIQFLLSDFTTFFKYQVVYFDWIQDNWSQFSKIAITYFSVYWVLRWGEFWSNHAFYIQNNAPKNKDACI